MNAVGMFQECWMGLFKGSLLSKGRCGPEGNHRIIIPPLLAFSFHTHTIHGSTHTFQWNILCIMTIKGRKLHMILVSFYKNLYFGGLKL